MKSGVFPLAAMALCMAAVPSLAADAAPIAAQPASEPVTAVTVVPESKPDPTLKAGDPAPKLSAGRWVKGTPVTAFECGKVYLVEFWATWCGPCKTSLPHAAALQARYRDQGLVVVGVAVWEPDPAQVEPFVKAMGEQMAFAVAVDEPIARSPATAPAAAMPAGRTAVDWLDAAGWETVPCTFIVDRAGTVAWTGPPTAADRPLGQILAGSFDPKAEAALAAKVDAMAAAATKAAAAKDYATALRLRDEIAALDPDRADAQRYAKLSLLMRKGDAAAANALAAELATTAEQKQDGQLAARTAALLLNAQGREKADKTVALRAAKLAYEASDKSAIYARLLAQAYAANRQYDQAVALQAKAAADAKGPLRAQDQKTLAEYQAAAAGIKAE